MNKQKLIWSTLRERRKKWTERLIRNNTWVTTIIKGRIYGKTVKRRPRTLFIKRLMENIGINTNAGLN